MWLYCFGLFLTLFLSLPLFLQQLLPYKKNLENDIILSEMHAGIFDISFIILYLFLPSFL